MFVTPNIDFVEFLSAPCSSLVLENRKIACISLFLKFSLLYSMNMNQPFAQYCGSLYPIQTDDLDEFPQATSQSCSYLCCCAGYSTHLVLI